MSKDRRPEDDDAMDAIRALVESNRNSLAVMHDEVMELEDVVWRSPTRLAIDPTETISRLAEEADKVARGDVSSLPEATILRETGRVEAAADRSHDASRDEHANPGHRADPTLNSSRLKPASVR